MGASYDFVIFGASPLAALLSGLLAHDHGSQVLRVADPVPKMRLSRGIDVALPFATRPPTWQLFRSSVAETVRLLTEIGGAQALDQSTIKIIPDLPETSIALAHMSHVAAGCGFASRAGVFLGVPRLVDEIDLSDSAVQTVETARVSLALDSSGGAELTLDGNPLPAGQIILADDGAILEQLPEGERHQTLRAEPMLATLTTPSKRLPAPIVGYPDRGVTLAQRTDGSVLALADAAADAEARLGSCLPGPFPLQRRATVHYRRVATTDGAPLIGRLEQRPVLLIAGLGSAAAFFAPPLARYLAGRPTDEEKQWFLAHEPTRSSRAAVADIVEIQP